MDRHHAELRPAQTISDVYMATNMDSAQVVAAGGSKQYVLIYIILGVGAQSLTPQIVEHFIVHRTVYVQATQPAFQRSSLMFSSPDL
jgi:lysine/ornithine N-monooxygenase